MQYFGGINMTLADYGIIFAGGMTTGMVLMAIAHLIGVVIKLFQKIVK